MTEHVRVLIIGGGPAGYTAAIYAARAALAPLLLQGLSPGGQLAITTEVENFPGFESIQGPELMERMAHQAERVGARLAADLVVGVDFSVRPFLIRTDSGQLYTADAVIIATGAQARWLGLAAEEQYRGFGVSACATCDGFFFKKKAVAVVGGGNSALEEALYLTHHADSVTIIHRRDTFRGEKILQERVLRHPKIRVIWNAAVCDILGTEAPRAVTGLGLRDTRSGAETEIAVDGLFVAIGHTPATELFTGQLRMDADGYILAGPGSTATSVPGVFAAGDVCDRAYRQAITAAGMGCMAALDAERFLA